MDTYYKNGRVKNLTNPPVCFAHIATAIFKVILLALISVMFFSYNNFAFGSFFAAFAYGYFFYGIFIKEPEKAQPSSYLGRSAWNASKSGRVKRDKQKSKKRGKYANYNMTKSNATSIPPPNSDDGNFKIGKPNHFSSNDDLQINPATGLPMIGAVDVAANPFGFDNSDLASGSSFDNDDFIDGSFSSDDHMTSFSDEF